VIQPRIVSAATRVRLLPGIAYVRSALVRIVAPVHRRVDLLPQGPLDNAVLEQVVEKILELVGENEPSIAQPHKIPPIWEDGPRRRPTMVAL